MMKGNEKVFAVPNAKIPNRDDCSNVYQEDVNDDNRSHSPWKLIAKHETPTVDSVMHFFFLIEHHQSYKSCGKNKEQQEQHPYPLQHILF